MSFEHSEQGLPSLLHLLSATGCIVGGRAAKKSREQLKGVVVLYEALERENVVKVGVLFFGSN